MGLCVLCFSRILCLRSPDELLESSKAVSVNIVKQNTKQEVSPLTRLHDPLTHSIFLQFVIREERKKVAEQRVVEVNDAGKELFEDNDEVPPLE